MISELVRRKTPALDQLDVKTERYVFGPAARFLSRYLMWHHGEHIFVEAGANDGIQQSNTYLFEKYHGWRGLLIEPIEEYAQKCRRNRPKCIVENVALVPMDYKFDTATMYKCGLMSTMKGALRSGKEEAGHIERGRKISNDFGEIEVRAMPLSQVLDRHKIGKIDLLSLDVEGYELQALRGLDFTRHRPTWILVEARYKEEVDEYLGAWYRKIDQFSEKDALYKIK